MTYNDYLGIVSNDFSKTEELQIDSYLIISMYEEEFKIQWIASKLIDKRDDEWNGSFS